MKTRILFVDDEPAVLNGLRRALRRLSAEWDMEFVSSGAAALAKLAEAPFDIIVSDMRMPGMTGAQLLARVRDEYPHTGRIVLSGDACDDDAAAVSRIAHQSMFKPVERDDLQMAVKRVIEMLKTSTDHRQRAGVAGIGSLPSLPQLYTELSRAAASENCTLTQIARVISRDMAMTAKLLQLVNSAFFGVGRRISSIEKTVAMLGVIRIKAIVLTEHVFNEFRPRDGALPFPAEALWRHSYLVAQTARAISDAEQQRGDRMDQAFTAGLLHDIGVLVLAAPDAQRSASLLEATSVTIDADDEQLDMSPMGPHHPEVGGQLLGLWGLPRRIVEAVSLHDNPSALEFDGMCAVTAVHAADALVGEHLTAALPQDWEGIGCTLDTAYLERIGLLERVDHWREIAAAICDRSEAVECEES